MAAAASARRRRVHELVVSRRASVLDTALVSLASGAAIRRGRSRLASAQSIVAPPSITRWEPVT